MRDLNSSELVAVSGGTGIYTDAHRAQFKSMVTGAVWGGIRGGASGFAFGLVSGAIKGMPSKKAN